MATAARSGGAWGGAVLKTVVSALKKGWPAGLTVLTGDDVYHLDRAQRLILDHLVPDRDDAFAWSVVGEAPITPQALVGRARSAGMFASRRVVLVSQISALEGDPEPLAAYAASPPSESHIVVRAPKLDRKRKLHKVLAEAGRCFVFKQPDNDAGMRELAAEVSALAEARNLRLDRAAIAFLIDVCAADLNRIASEIDKIGSWSGGQPGARIELATVRALVGGSGALSGWELADAVTERDARRAMEAARRLLDSGDEPIRIVGGLASRARTLLRAKALEESGEPAASVVDAVRAWYFRDALATGLKRFSRAELLAMPARLLEADRSFKSRGLDKGAVLESLVARMMRRAPER